MFGYRDSGGFHTRRAPGIDAIIAGKIFEVQSAAAGDGVYNCYEQKLLDAEWDDTEGTSKFDNKDAEPVEVEVFNLLENDPVADYAPALALYDRIQAWQVIDDEDNKRWVGIPLVEIPRLAITAEHAPEADNLKCNLVLNNGVEAAEGELGFEIDVYGTISGGGSLAFTVPTMAIEDPVFIENIQGKWWFPDPFIAIIYS